MKMRGKEGRIESEEGEKEKVGEAKEAVQAIRRLLDNKFISFVLAFCISLGFH